MARACAPSLGLGIVLLAAACRPAEAPTAEPTAVVSEPEPIVPAAGDDAPVGEPSDAEGFVVTLGSRCGDTWKGVIVRGGDGRDRDDGKSKFDISNASTHELEMLPGDALLLTSPHGGIMALVDNLAAGDDARVEVTPECSGVKRTIVRKP